MRVVLAVFIFSLIASAANVRVFFFTKENNGGATFRLQCVGSPSDNRCTREQFSSTGKSMCSGEDLVLNGLDPFSCVRDLESKTQLCKYANGSCSKAAGADLVKDRPSLEEENPTVEGLQRVEELPSVVELPELPEAGSQERPLPEAQNLPEVKPLPETEQSPGLAPGLPERNTGLPQREPFPQAN